MAQAAADPPTATAAPLMQLLRDRMAWTDLRETLLATNIANADTPGFAPRDLAAFGTALSRRQVLLARTDAGHLAGPAPEPPGAVPEPGQLRAPDGNSVNLEAEMAHLADNQTAHRIATQLYAKYMTMFRTTIGKA